MTTPRSKAWGVCFPPVVRYMEKQYVDRFFDTGELRLSCFAQFVQHRDEQREDRQEGRVLFDCRIADGGEIVGALYFGMQSFVLCGSTIYSEELMQSFGVDSYFRILNTTAFGTAVANVIPNCISGFEGPCIYKKGRLVERQNMPSVGDMEALKIDPDGKRKVETAIHQAIGVEPFLVKQLKYSHQSEYRFVWVVSEDVKESVTVYAPEARQFCERLLPRPKDGKNKLNADGEPEPILDWKSDQGVPEIYRSVVPQQNEKTPPIE